MAARGKSAQGSRARRRSRGVRLWSAVTASALLLIMVAQPATASLRFAASAATRSYAADPGKPPTVPKQHTGSAAGLPHVVGKDATASTAALPAGAHGPLAAPKGAVPASSKPPASPVVKPTKSTVRPEIGTTAKTPVKQDLKPVVGNGSFPADGTPGGPAAVGSFNPKSSVEVVAKRTETTSTYLNADGTYTAFAYTRPVHYEKPDGTWADIDTALRATSAGRFATVSSAQSADIAGKAGAGDLESVTLDASHRLGFGLAGAAAVTPVVSGSTATYAGIEPNADLSVSTQWDGISETLVRSEERRVGKECVP